MPERTDKEQVDQHTNLNLPQSFPSTPQYGAICPHQSTQPLFSLCRSVWCSLSLKLPLPQTSNRSMQGCLPLNPIPSDFTSSFHWRSCRTPLLEDFGITKTQTQEGSSSADVTLDSIWQCHHKYLQGLAIALTCCQKQYWKTGENSSQQMSHRYKYSVSHLHKGVHSLVHWKPPNSKRMGFKKKRKKMGVGWGWGGGLWGT